MDLQKSQSIILWLVRRKKGTSLSAKRRVLKNFLRKAKCEVFSKEL